MAKVKITGHASGSGVLTVTAPNTSTDRTITLPDSTGTLLDSTSTLDATKLSGNLPAISGAALTGVGVAGITSTANATAITIDANENVGIGVVPEAWHDERPSLQIGSGGSISGKDDVTDSQMQVSSNAYQARTSLNTGWDYINTQAAVNYYQQSGTHGFRVAPSGTADTAITWTNAMTITNDGRGLSQFTAKAWARIDMESSTAVLVDSHNISSLTDRGVGQGRVTFANNMANVNYTAVGNGFDGGGENDVRTLNHSNETRWRVNDFDFYTTDSSAIQDVQNATLIFFGD